MVTDYPQALSAVGLGTFVASHAKSGKPLVQPRMGFGPAAAMRRGLAAVRWSRAATVGTITLDSYTRVGDETGAERALASQAGLNGYPLLTHSSRTTRELLSGVAGPDFPVQVRHGSALASRIMDKALQCGLTAAEGGPVSYCLPYGRVPLPVATRDWAESCRILAQFPQAHLESFGGCMMGQLCPPSLLVALSVLECMFFRQHGLRSLSLSYAQQASHEQDREAVSVLRALAGEFLGDVDWHVVVYTYMGVFPKTRAGATELLRQSARLAVETGSERLIVKTIAEAHRIPDITDNVAALEAAHDAALSFERLPWTQRQIAEGGEIYAEARALVETVLNLSENIGAALVRAFSRGLLDVPYCLHPDNRNRARATLMPDGRLRWASVGGMPLPADAVARGRSAGCPPASAELLGMLSWVRRRYDTESFAA